MQNKNLGDFMPLIHVLWYLDKYLLGSGYSDAVVVVDDTPAMAAKIAMFLLRTKVAFLAVSTIKQKDLGNAVGGALQHAIIMRYMLEDNQTEQGATAATWDTQEAWLQRGIPLWVFDSNRGHEGHQQVHAAEAVREDVVTEAPAHDTEPVAPAKEGPYQDRPPLCPFRLLPLLIYSGSTIAFLKILKVQGPNSKNIENVILLQP